MNLYIFFKTMKCSTVPDKVIDALALRPEPNLLRCCARTVHNEASMREIQQFSASDIDWALLYELALRSHTDALLYQSLNTICPNNVPPSILADLKKRYIQGARSNLLMFAELLSIVQHLKAENIPVATFKGPVLAIQVYGDLALRRFSDLDILIHRADLWKAKDVLLKHNYRTFHTLSAKDEQDYANSHNDFPLIHTLRPVMLELQWEVIHEPFRFPVDIEHWWTRFVKVQLNGQELMTFSCEDMLLIMCVHGCKHLWERLGWCCDIAEFLRVYPTLDWSLILERAKQQGAQRMLWVGLLLAHDLLEASVPERILMQARRDPVAVQLAAQSAAFTLNITDQSEVVKQQAPLYYLAVRERHQDKLHMSSRFLPALRHPLRLISRYTQGIVKNKSS